MRTAGLGCSVLVAPVMPHLTDGADQLDALFGELAAAGATRVTVLPLHLRPGTREWFLLNLARDRPELVAEYERLYRRGAYLDRSYTDALKEKVAKLLRRHRFDPDDQTRWVQQVVEQQRPPPVVEPSLQSALCGARLP